MGMVHQGPRAPLLRARLAAVHEERLDKSAPAIRGMFGRIAPRYDLANRVLSLARDVAWRRRVARRVAASSPQRVLDVCTGTGDVALAVDRRGVTLASDFCMAMLARARSKAIQRRRELSLFAADTLVLPLRDAAVDVATVAFGVRNLADLESGLRELVRVLRPGGTLLVLEFSRPRGALAPLLGWWVRKLPPLVGRVVSGDPDAYGYLTVSVAEFPGPAELCRLLERVGLRPLAPRNLTGGVVTLYEAVKPVLDAAHSEV